MTVPGASNYEDGFFQADADPNSVNAAPGAYNLGDLVQILGVAIFDRGTKIMGYTKPICRTCTAIALLGMVRDLIENPQEFPEVEKMRESIEQALDQVEVYQDRLKNGHPDTPLFKHLEVRYGDGEEGEPGVVMGLALVDTSRN